MSDPVLVLVSAQAAAKIAFVGKPLRHQYVTDRQGRRMIVLLLSAKHYLICEVNGVEMEVLPR